MILFVSQILLILASKTAKLKWLCKKLQKNETFLVILIHCEVGFYCIGKRSDKEEEEWQAPFGLLANYTEYLEWWKRPEKGNKKVCNIAISPNQFFHFTKTIIGNKWKVAWIYTLLCVRKVWTSLSFFGDPQVIPKGNNSTRASYFRDQLLIEIDPI